MTLTEEAPPASALLPARGDETAVTAWPFVFAVALLLTIPLALAITRSAPRLAASNSKVLGSGVAIALSPGEERCQGGELVPASGASILLYIALPDGGPGPALVVRFLDRRGESVGSTTSPGGYSGDTLRLPFRGPRHDVPHGYACFRNQGKSTVLFAGNLTPFDPQTPRGPNSPGARSRQDEIRIDYFRSGAEPLWKLLPDIARRFSFFKPRFLGPWSMWAVLAAISGLGITAVLLLRRLARRAAARPAHWATACFAVALAQSALWAVVTPPLQTPDEMVHYSYAVHVSDTGKPPPVYLGRSRERSPIHVDRPDQPPAAAEAPPSAATLRDAGGDIARALPFSVEGKPTWSDFDEGALRARLADDARPNPRAAYNAAGGPPFYYYLLAGGTKPLTFLDGLDRLFAMRLVSSVLAALTAAFTVLFLAEVFRRVDLSVVLGGLAVALQPVLGFIGGGVHNDNLLYPVCALLFYLLARGFRRGMTPKIAILIGLTLGLGFLAKQRMLFLVPITLLAVLYPAWGSWRSGRARRLGSAAIATTSFIVIAGGWRLLASRVVERYGEALPRTRPVERSIRGALSYAWQSFFPRLWFMQDDFTRWPQYVFWDVYVEGFVGRFGWFQYDFPDWVEVVGGVVLGGFALLAGRGLWRARGRLRGRGVEFAVYVGLLLSTLVLLAIAGYDYRARTTYNLEQTRYLFPCLALYGGFVALAVRGVPTRFRWAAAAATATLFAGHVLSSMLLTVHRYYV